LIFQGVEICCPACKGELDSAGESESILVCLACGRQYPIIFGIPDLRICSDPYLSVDEDRSKAVELVNQFNQLDFPGLVSYYYHDKQDVPTNLIRQYTAGMMAGEARAVGAVQSWESMVGKQLLTGGARVMEIGCGTGPLLCALGKQGIGAVGVDVGLRWLVIGKRRLADAGLEFPLICACAEALPFGDQQYNLLLSESTLENLQDQKQALGECARVLQPGGYLCLSTPNKYSLGPDPHSGILAGGYLPDRWTAQIIQRRGGIPPRRRLLSAASLPALLAQAGFMHPIIALPDIPEGQRVHFSTGLRLAVDLYHRVKGLPIFRQLLRWIGPALYAVAQKPAPNVIGG
jgi:SAM-dependent methyltransferase/uncharacterized protein YbaR (Trm112 family)